MIYSIGRYACAASTIDGSLSKQLRVRTTELSDYGIMHSTINCPVGLNSECNIISDSSWYGFFCTVINANNTNKLECMSCIFIFI